MEYLVIEGGRPLAGQVYIQGSKNAVLPMISAALLNHGKTILHHCPKILDVEVMLEIIGCLGCDYGWEGDSIWIDAKALHGCHIPEHLASSMRSSITFLGSLLSRLGHARIPCPGGCVIGSRPIDLHLKALRNMGVSFREEEGLVEACCVKLCGVCIRLPFPSVGATENIILAAVLADGITCLKGAAREPEIVELCQLLKRMGACICGEGSDTIWIQGVKCLHDAEYTVASDRIVAGTYLCAAAVCGGELVLKKAPVCHLDSVLQLFRELGVCVIPEAEDELYICAKNRCKAISEIKTMPYPGFPTDLQSPLLSVLSLANGNSVLTETIFEDRFKVVEELKSMGAQIRVQGDTAYVRGVEKLHGGNLHAKELRGGAALCIAAAAAEGESHIYGCPYIFRGYENMIRDLTMMGIMVHLEKSD